MISLKSILDPHAAAAGYGITIEPGVGTTNTRAGFGGFPLGFALILNFLPVLLAASAGSARFHHNRDDRHPFWPTLRRNGRQYVFAKRKSPGARGCHLLRVHARHLDGSHASFARCEAGLVLFSANMRRALVTGGTDGIGKAVALRLARTGTGVIVAGSNAEKGKGAAHALRAASANEHVHCQFFGFKAPSRLKTGV
ncbi:MAG: SDR family NAD(P)-dependent oxidoreductase [Methylocella sp.]